MIKSLLLVDDESLFHLVFEDACSLLDIALHLQMVYTTDEAQSMFFRYAAEPAKKPECVFVDLNVVGSSFDGIELVRRINEEFKAGVVVGIISSSSDEGEQERARLAGANFWIVKTDEIEPRLVRFGKDYPGFLDGTKSFSVYA